MLSKARIKFIKSLQLKKYRKQEQCFVVEGGKSVLELLHSDFEVVQLLATPGFFDQNHKALMGLAREITEVEENELAGLGEYSANNAALAIVRMKPNRAPAVNTDEFFLMLDGIRDPGNLGTMLRTADWYGIKKIIASEDTGEVYNGKVIQSSMGSFTRVNIFYTDLEQYLTKNVLPVFGTFLAGDNVHNINFGTSGVIVIGNETNGISKEVEKFVTKRITIPKFGNAESLNAAIATAVICDNIRRRKS